MTRKEAILAALEGTHPTLGRRVAFGLYALIILSAVVITLETVPGVRATAGEALVTVEILLLLAFSTEYVLRLVCSPRPLDYALSFWGIVDLLAVLPALVFLVPDMQTVRTLRLFRIFRLFKLLRVRRAMIRLEHALSESRDELLLFGALAAIILFLSAVGIYHFEHRAQPEVFGSIPKALWWAIATLTTVGYGDVYPVTAGGRFFTACILFIGLGIVAIPAGVIASALLSARNIDETDAENDNQGDQTT